MNGRFVSCCLIFSLLTVAFIDSVTVAIDLRPVWYTGTQVPGHPGLTFTAGEFGVINNSGDVIALHGTVNSEGVHRGGIWVSSRNTTRPIVMEGESVPGFGPEFRFSEYDFRGSVSDGGFIAIHAVAQSDSSSHMGIWRSSSQGQLELLLAQGENAPGINEPFLGFGKNAPFVNNRGEILVFGRAGESLSTYSDGYWSVGKSGLSHVIFEGETVPDDSAWQFRHVSAFDGRWYDDRMTMVTAIESALDGASEDRDSVWRWIAEDGKQLVAREGDQVPGHPNLYYSNLYSPAFLPGGHIVLGSYLRSTGSSNTETAILRLGSNGEVSSVARVGEEASGTGFAFSHVWRPVPNAAGDIMFVGAVNEKEMHGLWVSENDDIRLAVWDNSEVPGMTRDYRFDIEATLSAAINSTGYVAISGAVVDSQTQSREYGVWVAKPTGDLLSIAVPGSLLEVAPGELRTVHSASFLSEDIVGTGHGQRTPLNDKGELVFDVSFTDGTRGMFVATVPEPQYGVLLTAISGLFLARGGMDQATVRSSPGP